MHDGLVADEVKDRSARRLVRPPPAALARPGTAGAATLAFCLLFGAAVHLALWQVSEPPTLFSDFYKAYFPAAEVLWEHGLQTSFPFTEVGAGGFVNVPIVGFLFVPLVPFGEEMAGWVFLGIGVAATVLAFMRLRAMARPEADATGALLLLFLINGPLINSLREGNTTHFVLLLLILALALLRRGSDFAAGVLLGACAVIKLPLLLFGVYFLLRRRWHVVAGGATAIAVVLLASVAAFGVANNVAWFNCCIEPFLGGIIPAFNVQSVDGFAVRLVTGTSRLANWDAMDPPAAWRIIRLCIFAATALAVVLVMRRASTRETGARASGRKPERELMEFALIVTLAIVVSPISWTHYYLLLLLPWGLFVGGQLTLASDTLASRLAWASIFLCTLPVVMRPLQADAIGEIAARTVVSAWFFGGVAMLLALLRGLYLLGTRPKPAGDRARGGA